MFEASGNQQIMFYIYDLHHAFTKFVIMNYFLGLLHRIVVGDVSNVSEIHADFMFRVTLNIYLRNINNFTNMHTV
jgi:hypothetical protein